MIRLIGFGLFIAGAAFGIGVVSLPPASGVPNPREGSLCLLDSPRAHSTGAARPEAGQLVERARRFYCCDVWVGDSGHDPDRAKLLKVHHAEAAE